MSSLGVLASSTLEPTAAGERKIKLLEFLVGFAFGGTERQFSYLVRGLDPRFELHTGCFKSLGTFLAEVRQRGVSLVEYKINCMYSHKTLRELLRLAAYIRRSGIDIVHSYGFYSNVFAIPAARLAGAPVVVASIRDMGDVWTPLQKRAQRLACRLADCVLVNSEAVRQRLVSEGYEPAKIAVIRNGISLPGGSARSGGSSLRRELGLPAQARLVAVLSVLRPLKGIEYFLQAAEVVSRRFPDAVFLVVGDSALRREGSEEVVGDSAYRGKLESHARRLSLNGRVIFTGFRPDGPELLSELAVSVLPSLTEGFSNVLLESMAAGVPVVATRVGGNPEAVDDGITGLLVPPRDGEALAEAICRLLDNPELASRLGQAARRRVAERFSVEAMVRATEKLYLDLLARTRPSPTDRPRRD